MSKLKIAFGITAFAIFTACYYDNEEYLYGKPGSGNCADTTEYTFSVGVKPILEKYCITCHSNASAASMGGSIKLQDYADVKIKAANGSLLGSISHSGSYSQMPKGREKMNDCNIIVIKKWINEGIPNN